MKNKVILIFILLAAGTFGQQVTPQASQGPLMLDTLDLRDMDINDVLKLLASRTGLNIIAGKTITGRVTIFLKNVEVHDALTTILKANDLAYMEGHGVVQIMTGTLYEQITGHKFGVNLESKVFSLQSVKPADAANILNQLKSQEGKVIADDQSNSIIIQDVPEKIEALGSIVKTIDVPQETRVFHINYAKINDLVKTIGMMLTKDVGSLEFDVRSSTLMLTDTPAKIDEISRVILALDKKDQEVFIDARIYQIALSDQYQMGIQWTKLLRTTHTKISFASLFPIPGAITTGVGQASIGTLNSSSYADVIQALDSFGKSRILSSPQLAVINNQEASILIGTTTPYSTTTTTATTTAPITAESINFIDTGVKLHVTPIIHDDSFITMKIKPEISNTEATPYRTAQGNSIPIVDTSVVQTTVRVKDGITIIIGGLIKNQMINNKTKIPVLGDLPLIGKVFGTTTRNVQKTEIVIFLTPHIINGDVRENPDSYINSSPTLKSEKTYYNPLPKDESTPPLP